MKVHVGCGRHVLDGWVNVDVQQHPRAPRAPEILCDLLEGIPLADGAADIVMAIHIIEHFYVWHVPQVLADWRRILRPGGELILELPDLEKACRNLLEGKSDQFSMWPLYGDPGPKDQYNCHHWGYTPKTMRALLEANGFKSVSAFPPREHGGKLSRDMRLEAVKA